MTKAKGKGKAKCPTTPDNRYETRSKSQQATTSMPMSDDVLSERMDIEAPETGTTLAASSSTTVIISPELSADVTHWKRADVQEFLEVNKDAYDLDDDDIEIVKRNKVSGVDLLKLTKEDFQSIELGLGPAIRIVELVEKLKENKGLVERADNRKRTFDEAQLEELKTTIVEGNNQLLREIQKEKRSSISISKAKEEHHATLLESLRLKERVISFDVSRSTTSIKPFAWTQSLTEQSHAKRYIKWLRTNISLPDRTVFYDAASERILNTYLESLPFNIKGTVDVAVVDQKNVDMAKIASGMRVGMELKKNVTRGDMRQAEIELILANVYSEYPVAIVLTNLWDQWYFFWLQQGEIIGCKFALQEAKTLLEDIVRGAPDVNTERSVPDANTPYNRRCTLEQVIRGGALRKNRKVEGLQEVLHRPKIDVMQLLPEDDVAKMQDVFDVMSPEEVLNWKHRRLLQYLEQTPAFQSSLST